MEDLLKYRNELPVEIVKTLTLCKPKRPRKPNEVKKEAEVIEMYRKGLGFNKHQGLGLNKHQDNAGLGIMAMKELLKHQGIDV